MCSYDYISKYTYFNAIATDFNGTIQLSKNEEVKLDCINEFMSNLLNINLECLDS